MQRLKQMLQSEERAVSPVIGVILMVAITVILAAVIASFVLGLGDETDDVSPNIVFDDSWDNSSGEGSVTFTVNTADGDADPDNIEIRGEAVTDDGVGWDGSIGAGDSTTLEVDGGELVLGDGSNADPLSDLPENGEVVIVFETDDTSDTLDTFTVPDQ